MRMTTPLRLSRWLRLAAVRAAWRRPPYPGAISTVMNLALVAALLWTARRQDLPAVAAPTLVGMVAAAHLVFGLQHGAQGVRQKLLAGPLVTLVQTTALPPADWVVAHLLRGALAMAERGLWTPVLLLVLAPRSVLRFGLPGWAASAGAGVTGMILGALSMIWWARFWTRNVTLGVLGLQLLQMAGGAWMLTQALRGEVPGLAGRVIVLLPSLLLALPGLWVLLRLAAGREQLGPFYRAAWLALREAATLGGPRRSRSVPGAPAVTVRDWLALLRNPIGKYRLGAVVAGLVAGPFLGRWLGAHANPALWLTGAGLLLWQVNAPEWIATALSGEGPALIWYRLAPSPPRRILGAKWLAMVAPPALLYGLTAVEMGLGAGQTNPWTLGLTVAVGCLGAGSIVLGLAACSPAPAPAWGGQEEQVRAWVGEQVPRTLGAVAGYLVAAGYLLLLLVVSAESGSAAAVTALLLTPPLALTIGLRRLHAAWLTAPGRRVV